MRVLFIGNSHTFFHDMPATFRRMCGELTGEEPEVTMLAYGGRSLIWHREEFPAPRFALLHGRYDCCVLQQQTHPFPPEEETRAGAAWFLDLCRETGTAPVLYETWAERDKPEHLEPIRRVFRALAEENGALLAPVGEVFAALRETQPDIDLYWQDGAHASPYGAYTAAACFARLLCRAPLAALSEKAWAFSPAPGAAEGFRRIGAELLSLDRAQTRAILAAVEEMIPLA